MLTNSQVSNTQQTCQITVPSAAALANKAITIAVPVMARAPTPRPTQSSQSNHARYDFVLRLE